MLSEPGLTEQFHFCKHYNQVLKIDELTNMKAEHKENSFEEWKSLSYEQQREIINNYWNPYEPEIGRKTRKNILNAFKEALNTELEYCEFGYFGFYTEAIFVIPTDSKRRLPTHFAGLLVNKGAKKEKLRNVEWMVQWKHSGRSSVKLNESNN